MVKKSFKKGFLDGIPIGLGYLSVSVGFGILAVSKGLSVLSAVIISMTNITSAGQVAGVTVIAAGGTLIEMALTQLVINIRYSLMAISLSQKLDGSFTTPHRLLTSAFITDEVFGVASTGAGTINVKYMYGLVTAPYIGWLVGTFIGAALERVLPASVTAALGIMIYGMFAAIVVPAMKTSRGTVIAVSIAAAVSCAIKYIPALGFISQGFSIIIAAVIASAAAAVLKPVQEEPDEA